MPASSSAPPTPCRQPRPRMCGWAPIPIGIYIQDSWKITRKLTFDYGMRWDYAILWKEQYGRMQNAAFAEPNTLIGGRLGTVEYQATCHCNYANALSVGFRTTLGSGLPDHAKDGVPRGRRHLVCGGIGSGWTKQQRRRLLHHPRVGLWRFRWASRSMGTPRGRETLTGIRWFIGRISIRSTRFPRRQA